MYLVLQQQPPMEVSLSDAFNITVTGFVKRDHIPHFPEIFSCWHFLNCHISTTIYGSKLIIGTVQALTFS